MRISIACLSGVLCLFAALGASAASDKLITVGNTQELLAAVKQAGKGSVTITMKPGAYVIDQPLRFTDTPLVNLRGSGWNTQLIRRGAGDAVVFARAGFCSVRDLLIEGDKTAASGSGIVFEPGCSSCTVENCRIVQFGSSGIRFRGDPKSPQSSNTVRNCHLINNGGEQLSSLHNNDFYIIGNQFGHDRWGRPERPRAGCRLEHSSAGTYSENYHWGNVNALQMVRCNFNRLVNNRFEESSEAGVVIGEDAEWSGGAYNILVGNTIHTNSQGNKGVHPAVLARQASMVTFTSNQILSWDSNSTMHRDGLVLGAGCSRWIVKDNIIHHWTGKPVVGDDSAAHIIRDNIVD